MSDKPRVRFAPSPTGYLHVGGARTALFNWLFARHNDGVFILRIEDTDLDRSDDEMVLAITEGLDWLDLNWDEGPFFQSEMVEEHKAAAYELLDQEKAYRCFCDPQELEALRTSAREKGEDWKYPGICRQLSADESIARAEKGDVCAIRFAMPQDRTITLHDLVLGDIDKQGSDLEDFVLLRLDGNPTYNLACVIDDSTMGITHVIRGEDHKDNAIKQILIYEALQLSIPEFAHVPLILGPDKKRLSKRHGATAVGEYSDRGYMPEAFVNFLSLLGWSPKDDTEFMRRDELISRFDLNGINRKPAVFDETKLGWLNGQYLNLLPTEELLSGARAAFETSGVDLSAVEDDYLKGVVDLLKERVRLFTEFPEKGTWFFTAPDSYDPDSVAKRWKNPEEVIPRLENTAESLNSAEIWDHDSIENAIRSLAEAEEVGAGKYIHAIRVAVSGVMQGPGLFELIELLGREEVVMRLQTAVDYLRAG